MGILTPLFRALEQRSLENPSTPLSAPDDWLYDALGSYRASSGVNVNRETALTYPPVWRAVNLIARDIAKLPLHVYKRWKRGKRPDWRHPAYGLLRYKPNPVMTAFAWRLCMATHVLLAGNAYSYIQRNGAGEPIELVPLSPDRTYPVRENAKLWFVTTVDQGLRKLDPVNVLHFKGLSYDGLVGYNITTKMREALGLGMAMESYASIYFRNNAEPRIVLTHPGKLSEQARTNLRESWERLHTGIENAHRTAILAEGMDAKQISLSARDSQLIDSRKFSMIEVANFFGIPPHKLGADIQTSYNSLEQQNQAYLDEALDPWLVSIEEECWDKLLTEEQKQRGTHHVVFDRRQLLRADLATRTTFYVQGLQNGFLNIDEVRDEEDLNPAPDDLGQAFRVPLNQVQLGVAAAGDDGAQAPAAGAELLDVPDVRQSTTYDCGAAAALAVAQYFGVDNGDTEVDWIKALDTRPGDGTHPRHIISVLVARGLVATASQDLTVEDLARFFASGHPIICPIQAYGSAEAEAEGQSGHYVVVIGVGLGMVFVQDPAAGRALFTEEDWLAAWHDLEKLPDGSEVPIVRYGIAIGEELVEEPEEDDPDEGDASGAGGDPPDPKTGGTQDQGDDDDDTSGGDVQRSRAAQALRPVLEAEFRRAAKRLAAQARRAAKDPRSFTDWLDAVAGEQRGTIIESLTPAVTAIVGLTGRAIFAAELADRLLAQVKESLDAAAGRATTAQLAAEVDRLVIDLENQLPASLAGELFGGF